jgi:hypothetical protein
MIVERNDIFMANSKKNYYILISAILEFVFAIEILCVFRLKIYNYTNLVILLADFAFLFIINIFGVIIWKKEGKKYIWAIWSHKGKFGILKVFSTVALILSMLSLWIY